MAFWNTKPKPQLPDWDMAKKITKAEAQNPALPLGWYIYKDGYIWYGLRPNEERTGLEQSYQKSNPKDLEEWLGKPIPEEAAAPKELSLEEIVAQATQACATEPQPPAKQASQKSLSPNLPAARVGTVFWYVLRTANWYSFASGFVSPAKIKAPLSGKPPLPARLSKRMAIQKTLRTVRHFMHCMQRWAGSAVCSK